MKLFKNLSLGLFVIFIWFITGPKSYAVQMVDIKIGSPGQNIQISSGGNIYIKDRSYNELNQIYSGDLNIKVEGNRVLIDGQDYDIDQILIGSDQELVYNKNSYRGYFRIARLASSLNIINHLEMDDYLKGVLPKEMGASFPQEALKAQAVASRSFAMTNLGKHKSEGYNLCNTTHCQVYGGRVGEHPTINEVIDSTRGELVYLDNRPAETVFHSSNGGYMESSKNAWGSHVDYLVSSPDPYSQNTVNSNWTLEFTRVELEKKLKGAGLKIGQLIDIRILNKNTSQRVEELEIIGSLKSEIISGSKFRSALGNNTLKSTLFTINGDSIFESSPDYDLYMEDYLAKEKNRLEKLTVEGSLGKMELSLDEIYILGRQENKSGQATNHLTRDKFVIKGSGFGHGVGMSQYGAKKMAEEGFLYKDILRHYYKGTEIY